MSTSTASSDSASATTDKSRARSGLVGWALGLPMQRKILFFLAGGMVTLVFDAFVSHFSWKNQTMRTTQKIPIIYGLAAAVALGIAALLQLPEKAHKRVVLGVGAVGMAVGLTGVFLHGQTVLENLSGEPFEFLSVGNALNLSAPLFAPAAFAGVGLLLIALNRIAPMGPGR